MKTYRSLVNWLVQRDHLDVLLEIVVQSKCRNNLGPLGHWLLILMDQVSEHLREGLRSDLSKPFGSPENRGAFFDVWLFLDCPGLDDEAVVATMREKSIWDEYMEH